MTRAEVIASLTPDEVVSAVQRHLNAGVIGFHGLYAQHQMDYRASYHEVCLLSSEWSNRDGLFDEPLVKELRELVNRLGTTPAIDPAVFACNTTFIGAEDRITDLARAA